MKYFKYIDVEEKKKKIIYNEFDAEYYCFRAVFEENNMLFTTNFIDYDHLLPEVSCYDIIDDLVKDYFGEYITQNEFNNKWRIALDPFMEKWNIIKEKYIIGNNIKAKINCFYPQGIIIDITETFYRISDYNLCKIKYGEKYLYPNNEMDMEVIGHDENNMWIKLKPLLTKE
jgi:hypothetical protein